MATASLEIISATRMPEQEFWQRSALGISLRRLAAGGDTFSVSINFANQRGLPALYNERIRADAVPDEIVFIHDDVWIDDHFFIQRVHDALECFDIVGVAGNKRSFPSQPSWIFVDDKLTYEDRANLSGMVAHGAQPFGRIGRFGPAPAECQVLDGLLLAANRKKLRNHDLFFDERFDFHFYDIDFCRAARRANLRLGTWPISVTHQSGGGFTSPAWRSAYTRYLDKWRDSGS